MLQRTDIDDIRWNACVKASPQREVYGYSWYLDSVTSEQDWTWAGLVMQLTNPDYHAVMPVPLRRKYGRWVVHQPLFCQFLDVFSHDEQLDIAPFFQALQHNFAYGSILHVRRLPVGLAANFDIDQSNTHRLSLNQPYELIYRGYRPERRRHLRRAQRFNWEIRVSEDIAPMLDLFRNYHADQISGGVADWSYTVFRELFMALKQRSMVQLLYAYEPQSEQPQAGVLLVREGDILIYLFNAATEKGRREHARSWIIDQYIQHMATPDLTATNCYLDLESPDVPTIASFYQGFGAKASPFWRLRWNKLTWIENCLLAVVRLLNQFIRKR